MLQSLGLCLMFSGERKPVEYIVTIDIHTYAKYLYTHEKITLPNKIQVKIKLNKKIKFY